VKVEVEVKRILVMARVLGDRRLPNSWIKLDNKGLSSASNCSNMLDKLHCTGHLRMLASRVTDQINVVVTET
jgi:hypothetical protein